MQKSKKNIAVICILITIISISLALLENSEKIVSVWANKKELPIYSVETDKKRVAISFDCAWGVEHTDKLLEEMERFNVKCTFFPVEFWSKKYPDYVKKIHDSGHEFGTHSATHSHMPKLSQDDIKSELLSSAKAIEDITGQKVTLFRPPFGDYDNKLILTSRSLGFEVIQWDVDSLDWKDLSAEQIATRVISKVKNGSIILCHNNGLHTAEALPLIFTALQNKGFEFVPIGQLIIKEKYYIDSSGRQHADL